MNEQAQPVFVIEKIYVKDLSLEIPNAPAIFLERDTPEINMQLGGKNQNIDEDMFEVLLTVTITAKIKDKIMFLVEVQQAGIFRIRNLSDEEIDPVLGIGCPNILFPYLREVVSDIVTRAGFPPVILSPVNFEVIYQQKKAEMNKAN
ncbi:MAG: protein-export chaperone SecB [Nitrosomonas sp.]|nr:MAG: protein-export chaperone SecB [Nitrosomonas sp.]